MPSLLQGPNPLSVLKKKKKPVVTNDKKLNNGEGSVKRKRRRKRRKTSQKEDETQDGDLRGSLRVVFELTFLDYNVLYVL